MIKWHASNHHSFNHLALVLTCRVLSMSAFHKLFHQHQYEGLTVECEWRTLAFGWDICVENYSNYPLLEHSITLNLYARRWMLIQAILQMTPIIECHMREYRKKKKNYQMPLNIDSISNELTSFLFEFSMIEYLTFVNRIVSFQSLLLSDTFENLI